jgi:hypothetical protein
MSGSLAGKTSLMKLRYKIVLGMCLVALALVWYLGNKALDLAAHGMSTAPNAGRAIDPFSDPSPSQIDQQGVHRQLRVDVQPAASLSICRTVPLATRFSSCTGFAATRPTC